MIEVGLTIHVFARGDFGRDLSFVGVRTSLFQFGVSVRLTAVLLLCGRIAAADAIPGFVDGGVVGFAGGADVAAAQLTGHLESILTTANQGKRIQFRSFAWEGDTVFDQPRDYGFPNLITHLKEAGVTLLFLQFGRAEALNGNPRDFEEHYSRWIENDLRESNAKLVLVTPPPFENPGEPLPNLAEKNRALNEFVEATRRLARQHNLPVVDLYSELSRKGGAHRLTDDGLQLTAAGHAAVALAFARQLGIKPEPQLRYDKKGRWQNADFEKLRQAIIRKNRLWLQYWRPHNWAFLGGDRISQPSSRDHKNPEERWFPDEMKKFPALIREQETEIAQIASRIR